MGQFAQLQGKNDFLNILLEVKYEYKEWISTQILENFI
jgi:hypothetical protein